MKGVSGIDYQAMRALVALSNDQLGQTIWHFLKKQRTEQAQLVSTPEEAVQRMLSIDYNLIFLDFDFGKLGGVDFTKFVRLCDGAVSEAPIVMVMPNPSKEKVFACRDAGVNEIIGLPLSAKQVETRLGHIYNHPKPFVRCTTYIGPCRRREQMQVYHGQERRKNPQTVPQPSSMTRAAG